MPDTRKMSRAIDWGNGYEAGLAAGKASSSWQPKPWTRIEKWKEALTEAPTTHAPGRDAATVLDELGQWSQEDLRVHAAGLHRKKMDVLPDLDRYPELKGMDQYLDERAAGFAEGAGIDVRKVYLEEYWREILFYVTGPQPGSCSEFFLPDTPNGPLLGKGWDDILAWYTDNPFPLPPREPQEPATTTIPPQEESGGYRRFGKVNEAGLCLDTGGGGQYEYEAERDQVLFPVPVYDLVMRSCATAPEAVEVLTRYNLYWGPTNCIGGVVGGRAALIEKSKYQYAVRMGSGQVLISTYGGCEDEGLRKLCDTGTPVFQYYERRLAVMKEVMAQAGGRPDLETYWAALLHHDPQAPGCQHRENMPPGVELFTLGGSALLLRERRILDRTIAREESGIRYVCANPPVETRYRFA